MAKTLRSSGSTFSQWFWGMVDITPGDCCWEWRGSRFLFKNRINYGRVSISGRWTGTHRIAWELIHGPISFGLVVAHRCDNPPCVRPSHLFLATQANNLADCRSKDRHVHGDRHWLRAAPGRVTEISGERSFSRKHPERLLRGSELPQAKVDESAVIEMRRDYTARLFTQRQLAAKYGISVPAVKKIVQRKHWKHV